MYLVNFNPTVGREINKTRPALILQNNIANRWSPITVVAVITSHLHKSLYPTEVIVRQPEGGLWSDSAVLLNQIRSIDRKRLVKRLGSLKPETMLRVERSLRISLGLISF